MRLVPTARHSGRRTPNWLKVLTLAIGIAGVLGLVTQGFSASGPAVSGSPDVAALPAHAGAVPLPGDAASGLSGMVTDAETGRPLPGVEVGVFDALGSPAGTAISDSAGHYRVGGLPPGAYYARTSNALGYVNQLLGETGPCFGCDTRDGVPVWIADGDAVGGIDFALRRGGGVSGTVTDAATGSPLGRVTIVFFTQAMKTAATAITGVDGRYSLGEGLPAGVYLIQATNDQGYADEIYADASCADCQALPTGMGVPVIIGETTAGIDFALTTGGRIAGLVSSGVGGAPLPGVDVLVLAPDGTLAARGRTDSRGRYLTAGGLAGGTYFVRTANRSGYLDELYAGTACPYGQCQAARDGAGVTVDGSTTTGEIDFALLPGGRFAGTVVDDISDSGLPGVEVLVFDDAGTLVETVMSDLSGRFITGTGLPSGAYRARTSNRFGYRDELYRDMPCPVGLCELGKGLPIVVSAGATTKGIDFRIRNVQAAADPVSTAVCTLPADYTAGTAFTVSILVTPLADVFVQAIEDAPPAGWTAANISGGGAWDAVNKKVKWGPFFDATVRTLTYEVTPPAGSVGLKTFIGLASFDGIDVAIGGARTISAPAVTPTITWAAPAPIAYGTALGATQLNATASSGGSAVPGTFVYTPATGTVLNVGAGQTLSVTFTPTDAVSYTTATKDVTIDVTKATPVITWAAPAPIVYGTALGGTQLNATASVAGTFVYTPAAAAVLPAGTQTLSTTFTPTDAVNYTTATKDVSIEVTKATPIITWAAPAPIVYGTALGATQLNATASVAGTFGYNPLAGSTLPVGTQTLSVTFAPFDLANYTTATKDVTIDVTQATPVITWAAPASISQGTALSGAQLNATASVAGTFEYTPAAGTVLPAGSQTLSTTFTPTDTVSYTTATKDVTIEVTKAVPVITWAAPAPIVYGTALNGTQLNATASVAGAFVYTPAAGAVMAVGTQTLSVTFTPTDAANYTTATKDVAIEVTKATPVITWAAPAPITYGTALGGAQLNATANVAGAFVYTPAAGAVPNAGTQTLSTTFTPTDAANYTTATKDVTLEVGKATPVITWATPAGIPLGTPLGGAQLNATANVAGTFVYVPAAGTVLPLGPQTLSTTFTPTDAANYTTATKDVTLEVGKATPVITWAAPAPIVYGTALNGTQLNATADVAGTFVYTPAAGAVLAVGTQTLSATFTPTDAANYTTATKDVTIEVTKATPVITWAAPAPIVYGTALDGTQLNATANVAGTFAYTPAAGAVPNGGTQTLSVTFTPTDAANYTAATKDVTIEVTKATPVITWAAPAPVVYLTALGAAQLNATANVAGAFVYTPAAGAVLAVGPHTLSATFTPTDTGNYTTATKDVTIDVTKATPVIAWAAPAAIPQGTALGAAQLNATASTAGAFDYTPAAGTMLAVGTHTLSTTFTPTDTANYTTATKDVTIEVTKATPVITWAAPASIVYGTALDGTQLNATANVAGTFVYLPAAGAVPNAGTQTLSVTFTPTDAANYTTTTKDVTLEVTKATPVVTWANPAPIVYGTALDGTQLNATANVAGTFAYTPAAGAVPNAGTQTLSATFTPTDAANYATATKDVTIEVTQATPVITWAAPAPIVYGAALGGSQLNATASVAGAFVYTPAAGAVLAVGPHTLSATFTPTDTINYTTATKDVTIDVTMATPVITWAPPAPIPQGTALGAAQLNATANTAGAFVYTPAAGAVLTVGTHTLSATFTPADTANYTTATKDVTIEVTKATPVITWAAPAPIKHGEALTNVQLNATANVAGTFVYTPAAGTVLPTGTHTLSVTFTPTDAANYTTASATVSLTVASDWEDFVGPQNGGGYMGKIVNGQFVYQDVAYPIVNGTVTFPDCWRWLVAPNGALFAGAPAPNCTPGVGTAPVITWPAPAGINEGAELSGTQLNATANVPGTFVYTPPAGTVLAQGTHTLSTAFTPTDTANYATATKAVTLQVYPAPGAFMGPQNGGGWSGQIVNGQFVYRGVVYPIVNGTVTFPDCMKYLVAPNGALFAGVRVANCTPGIGTTPEVTWGPPAAITQGTALSGAQLNATASVPGTFSYKPPAGTVLPVGTHTLTALFTPSDPVAYTTAPASVTLVVNAGDATGFIGPHSGGGWMGQIVNGQFVYRGVTYPIVNGTVTFPDCMMYLVAPNGALFGGTRVANCAPGVPPSD